MASHFDPLRRALDQATAASGDVEVVRDFARVEVRRERRKGVPEIVYAASKRADQVVEICRRFLDATDRVIVSRTPPDTATLLVEEFASDYAVDHRPASQIVVIRRHGTAPPRTGGRVAIFTAGTSDLPVAEEAEIVAHEMGCEVQMVADVGVAAIHRLFEPLGRILTEGVDVIIVAAGMDGALPSVIAGLAPAPVIGLPTPVGYGHGGLGEAALSTMLQSCAPGLAVVNIGNGVGAGTMAALIANQIAAARRAN